MDIFEVILNQSGGEGGMGRLTDSKHSAYQRLPAAVLAHLKLCRPRICAAQKKVWAHLEAMGTSRQTQRTG